MSGTEALVVGRVYIGDSIPQELRVTHSRAYVEVIITPRDGQVWLSQSTTVASPVTVEQSKLLADLQARAHKAAPAIVAAYATCERAHGTATSVRDRITRNALKGAAK